MHTCSPRQHLGSRRSRRVRNPRASLAVGRPCHAHNTLPGWEFLLRFPGALPPAGRPAVSEQNNEILLILLGGSPEDGEDFFQPPVPPSLGANADCGDRPARGI